MRLVCHFSCGAASAVATKLAIQENRRTQNLPIVILNEFIAEEHEDNQRFKADCQNWFDEPIITIMNEKYHGSIYEAFEGESYIAGVAGAVCTRVLKKEMAAKFWRPGDIDVIGYTSEEQDRYDNWIDANNERRGWPVLIERGLMKADCLALVERAGIALPAMYEWFEHNNCPECVKAGAGHWDKVRRVFPLRFQRMAEFSRKKGVRLIKLDGERIFLDELPVGRGNYPVEPSVQCGIFCELAEKEMI
jgi:hypothetical protein